MGEVPEIQFWELQSMDPCSLGGSLLLHNRCILLPARAHVGLA